MIDVLEICNDKNYKLALANALASVRGIENKEDAESSAIVALLEQEPITIEDCITCMKRAIYRFNNHNRRIMSHETSINEIFGANE